MSTRHGTSLVGVFQANLDRGGESVRASCGIDWASEWHDVHITDEHGSVPRGCTVRSRRARCQRADRAAPKPRASSVPRSSDPMDCSSDGCGRRRSPVLAIHPNQVKAARDRFRAAAGKNDRFDAFVLCELARTDRHRFPRLTPIQRRNARAEGPHAHPRRPDRRESRTGQPVAQPSASVLARRGTIFADIDSSIGLAFLERYPSPNDARGLGEKRLQSFLARHKYCGRRTPERAARQAAQRTPRPSLANSRATHAAPAVLGLVSALAPHR